MLWTKVFGDENENDEDDDYFGKSFCLGEDDDYNDDDYNDDEGDDEEEKEEKESERKKKERKRNDKDEDDDDDEDEKIDITTPKKPRLQKQSPTFPQPHLSSKHTQNNPSYIF